MKKILPVITFIIGLAIGSNLKTINDILLFRNIVSEFQGGNVSHRADKAEFEEVAKKVEKTVIEEPLKYIKKAEILKSIKPLSRLQGKFKGDIFFIAGDSKGGIDQFILEMNYTQYNGIISGKYFLEISNKGDPYSTSKGIGNNTQIKTVENKENQILLETSPKSFLHIEIHDGIDYFLGKYYEENVFVGLVKIYRLN